MQAVTKSNEPLELKTGTNVANLPISDKVLFRFKLLVRI